MKFETMLFFIYCFVGVSASRSAFALLTRRPVPETIHFLESFAQDAIRYNLDVFIVVDDNRFNGSSIHLRFVRIKTEVCVHYGYQKTTSLGPRWSNTTAWDKALIYFNLINKEYSYLWLVEDDVFIPSTRAFLALHELYADVSDFVVARNTMNLRGDTSKWWWRMAKGLLSLPWSCSMVNVVGMSRRMLNAVEDYVRWRGVVPFHEFFLNTLAWQLNYTIITPVELRDIIYAGRYVWEQIEKDPNNLWHSVKNSSIRQTWREKLKNVTSTGRFPVNQTRLQTLCNEKMNRKETEIYLTDFLTNFNKYKTHFSSIERRSLREQFSSVLQRCKKLSKSSQITSLLEQLMNHAYKLPELPFEELVKKKSEFHLWLEKELKLNKENVFQLSLNIIRNSSEIILLREKAKNLTSALIVEIQREMNEQNEKQKNEFFFEFQISNEKRIRADFHQKSVLIRFEENPMTLNGFGNGTVVNSSIPMDLIRRRKELLRREIQEIREKIAQCEVEMSMIQSHSNDDRRHSNAKQWSMGKKLFNENSKEGARWLIENGLIQNTPEYVAAFLFNETGLSKRAIGDYLGEKDDFHIEVLKHFAHMHDFFSMDIVDALRRYLFTFILPGEAQKIDRIMEAFAQRYYECNPRLFSNAEVCYIVSFAIIMLNTSLHNKNARLGGVFTYEKFVNSLNETIARDQIPDQTTIRTIYDNIKMNELKFPDDETNFAHPILANDSTIIKEGYLWKQGGRVRNWKRRWFAITDGCLFYFESRTETEVPRGVIPLIDVGVREVEEDRTKAFCFELFPLTGDRVKASKPTPGDLGKWIDGHHSVYRMSAASEDERKDWIRALRIGSQNQLPKQR